MSDDRPTTPEAVKERNERLGAVIASLLSPLHTVLGQLQSSRETIAARKPPAARAPRKG